MKVLHIWWTLGCPVMYIPPVLYPQSPEIPHRRAHTHTELSKNKCKYKNQCRGETLPKFSSPLSTLSFHLAPPANIPAESGSPKMQKWHPILDLRAILGVAPAEIFTGP